MSADLKGDLAHVAFTNEIVLISSKIIPIIFDVLDFLCKGDLLSWVWICLNLFVNLHDIFVN